jgi:protein-serine/threonine kinase
MADYDMQNSSNYSSGSPSSGGFGGNGGQEYVVFDRSTEGFSKGTLDRSTAAKLKLEHFYKVTLDQARERNDR